MVAKWIDTAAPEDEEAKFDELGVNNEEAQVEEQPVEEQAPPPEDELPEKYRGKSLEDLARMHQEAESLIGRHSSEVGELRKVVDDFITNQQQTVQSTTTEQAPHSDGTDDLDFFTDPKNALDRYLANHPKFKEVENYSRVQQREASMAALKNKHPDFTTVVQDSKFQQWVQASKIRTALFAQADQEYNFDAADELLSLWKERTDVVKQTVAAEKQQRKNTAQRASTGTGKGSNPPSRKKIYRRADIIRLMNSDPQRYAALNDEIMAAYAEGRVR